MHLNIYHLFHLFKLTRYPSHFYIMQHQAMSYAWRIGSGQFYPYRPDMLYWYWGHQETIQIDWGEFSFPDILRGRQQGRWNSVNETACAEFPGHGDRSFMNIVLKQGTLSNFLRRTTSKNETSSIKKTCQLLKYIWHFLHEPKHRFNGDESRRGSTVYIAFRYYLTKI